jgi:hypothetical protein
MSNISPASRHGRAAVKAGHMIDKSFQVIGFDCVSRQVSLAGMAVALTIGRAMRFAVIRGLVAGPYHGVFRMIFQSAYHRIPGSEYGR